MMLFDLIEIGSCMDMMHHEKGNATGRGIGERRSYRNNQKVVGVVLVK